MGNFVEAFLQGQNGGNKGLNCGIPAINQAINGIQRKTIAGFAAPPKV